MQPAEQLVPHPRKDHPPPHPLRRSNALRPAVEQETGPEDSNRPEDANSVVAKALVDSAAQLVKSDVGTLLTEAD